MSVTIGQAVLLGIVQGLTEFLPVSSTAHLALAQSLLKGFSQPGILFDVLLHVGTLAAVVVYFRQRIAATARGLFSGDPAERRAAWKLVLLLALAVALTGAVGIPLRKLFPGAVTDLRAVGAALVLTSIVLLVAEIVGIRRGLHGKSLEEIKPADAALVGACQAASAVIHGLSRSGNTISVGLFTGMSRKAAAEFSFLLSIPTILAAALVENLHAWRHHELPFSVPGETTAYLAGMAVSAVVGYAAVAVLIRAIVKMRLVPFVLYTVALGIFLIVWGPRIGTGSIQEARVALPSAAAAR